MLLNIKINLLLLTIPRLISQVIVLLARNLPIVNDSQQTQIFLTDYQQLWYNNSVRVQRFL
ncbi:hypothetical protein [Synechococcus phage metaG-MbCM1]|jgi:hypothetical protein|uniref:Uncharacterized protein n=1 Tax=Synechococcus phage metaG-MbCM1 TaxID=1079999 RepID=H8ZN62_9CAUD|nr:hypothetical protein [Synechococcus phage metaG-MbCM1]AFD02923.1 hypothetical protein [Synechococcus phage metaG-MbCM1]